MAFSTTAPMLTWDEPNRLGNPYIPIRPAHRALIIGYVLFYSIFTPGLSLFIHGPQGPMAGQRFIAETVLQVLVILPLLCYRSSFGWLHPLIYPALFLMARQLVRSPEVLITPYLVFEAPLEGEMAHVALRGWSQEALAQVALKASLLQIASLLAYYAGFFLFPRLPVPRLTFPSPKSVNSKALTTVVAAGFMFLLYMQTQGGLTSHMLSWSQGRSIALEGDGPFFVLINMGMLATLIWFALSNTAFRNPVFWAAAAFSIPINFFVKGSRSSVIYMCAMFLIVWMLRSKKLPQARVLLLGVVAFLLFGALGLLRSSVYNDEIDWTVFTKFDVQAVMERAKLEADNRSNNAGSMPIIARVPLELDLLKGESYVSVVLFWVPRALWPEKPQGAAYMNGLLNFGSKNGTALPTGGVAEAYWNFHLPGVLVIYLFFGIFHSWLARTFRRYGHHAAAWPLYALTLTYAFPDGIQMVNYLQAIIPAIAILAWMGAISRRAPRMVQVPAWA